MGNEFWRQENLYPQVEAQAEDNRSLSNIRLEHINRYHRLILNT